MSQAPSINLLSKAAREAGEAAEKAKDAERPGPTAEEQLAHMAVVERKTGSSGLVPRTPKQTMLDVSSITKKYPTRHFRWVNIGSNDKAMNSTLNGYSQHLEDGKPVTRGNLQLWSCPRSEFEARRAEREALTAASLDVDSQGRRNDSSEFYHEADKISSMTRQRGHRRSRPSDIVKDNLDGVNL